MAGRRIDSLGDEFMGLFRGFEHSAYRLETLQAYAVDYETEPIRQFLAGEQLDDPSKREWCALIRDAVAAGKTMSRVHVVEEPLTDYLRYELGYSYGPNVDAGERIGLIPVAVGDWLEGLPRGYDYWLFDSRDLWVMVYGDGGEFLYAEHVEDPVEVVRHNHLRDLAAHAAVEYLEFVRARPELLALARGYFSGLEGDPPSLPSRQPETTPKPADRGGKGRGAPRVAPGDLRGISVVHPAGASPPREELPRLQGRGRSEKGFDNRT